MTYYQRLKVYGWKQFYRGARWDYFRKRDKRGVLWIVAVPATTYAEPIFHRDGHRITPCKAIKAN